MLEGNIPKILFNCQQLQIVSLERNDFTGDVPQELSTLSFLRVFFIGENKITGTIPPSFGNLSELEWLGLELNDIFGNIPAELGRLPNLEGLNVAVNHLNGSIPLEILNMSSLYHLELSSNALSLDLQSVIGFWLPDLGYLHANDNRLTGNIPLYLSNSSKLESLLFAGNELTGSIPTSLIQLKSLTYLWLQENQLSGNIPSELFNSSLLVELYLYSNLLTGPIPRSIGHLKFIEKLEFAINKLTGQLPQEIGFLQNAIKVDLSSNNLNGSIPSTIGGIESLQMLYLSGNELEGSIPSEICLLKNVGDLYLQGNKLSGSIPNCIGDLVNLKFLVLSSNKLDSIPTSLWNLQNLVLLNLSFNSFTGSLEPNIRSSKVLGSLDLSWNQITGNIPIATGGFESLTSLNLSQNSFSGSIPESLSSLIALDFLDCSHNNLSGQIPKSLESLSHLQYLNFSYNNLFGEIPSGGPFAKLTSQSFLGNEALCGNLSFKVQICSRDKISKNSRMRNILLKYVLPPMTSVAILVVLFCALKRYKTKNVQSSHSNEFLQRVEHMFVSYHELQQATNDFSEANLVGVGNFGSVYKGVLLNGMNVAIKLLNLRVEGAYKSFDAECRVLRMVRHRNLVKVISVCSNPELRALVLQYMSNGSLEKWLYSHNYCLDLFQRVNIALDVALALEYLHYGLLEPVVHCDLKPNNILLDEDMVAHVGDFGIAKVLVENQNETETMTLGTLGYIAPEYGSEGKVSTKGDMYSYGIILLDIFTGKKPTDEMFNGEQSLIQWVNASLPNLVMNVIDKRLTIRSNDENNLVDILKLGLDCSKELPDERCNMKQVVVKMSKIKLSVLQNS